MTPQTFDGLLSLRRRGVHNVIDPIKISLVGRIRNVTCLPYKTGDDLRGVFGLDVQVLHAGENIERILQFIDELCACKPWTVDLVNVITGQEIAIARFGEKRLKEIRYASTPL